MLLWTASHPKRIQSMMVFTVRPPTRFHLRKNDTLRATSNPIYCFTDDSTLISPFWFIKIFNNPSNKESWENFLMRFQKCSWLQCNKDSIQRIAKKQHINLDFCTELQNIFLRNNCSNSIRIKYNGGSFNWVHIFFRYLSLFFTHTFIMYGILNIFVFTWIFNSLHTSLNYFTILELKRDEPLQKKSLPPMRI